MKRPSYLHLVENAIIHEGTGLYQIKFLKAHVAESVALVHLSSNIDKLALWHRRLGHLNVKSVKALQAMVLSMDLFHLHVKHYSFIYEGCIEGKQRELPFPVEGAIFCYQATLDCLFRCMWADGNQVQWGRQVLCHIYR